MLNMTFEELIIIDCKPENKWQNILFVYSNYEKKKCIWKTYELKVNVLES